MKIKENSSVHVEDPRGHDIAPGSEKPLGQTGEWHSSTEDAHQANLKEHDMKVWDAITSYPWAVFWSLLVSMSIIMEGYDTILIGSFFGYPAFRRQFGEYNPTSGYQVPGPWQVGLANGPVAGSILGVFFNGWLSTRFGYKRVFLGALFLMNAFIFISFFGKTVEVQTVGQVMMGLPWGVFATIGPAYASEILPLALRGYLTAYTNICFATGQFIGAGVLQSLVNRPGQWSYRVPFAIQWLWPVPLMLVGLMLPESPWWLVRQGRPDDAEKSMKRLTSKKAKTTPEEAVALMIHTNVLEKDIDSGSSYLDCFKSYDLRRTEIACVVFAGQVFCGSQFAYSGTYFFEQAGMSSTDAYKLSLGGTAIAFVGTILSWFLMNRLGRRTIYMAGLTSMATCLFVIGCLTLGSKHGGVVWAQSALCIVWLFSFSLSVGPIGWAIPAEVSSTRLRAKTICLARNSYYLVQLFANIIEPYMMNPTEWNWKGKTGFFWFGFAFLTLVWSFFRLPETKGRSFEELGIMFAARVPTWKFKRYQVNAYDESVTVKDRAKEV